MAARELAAIVTPKQGNVLPSGTVYCADNGRYGKGWPGYMKWYSWLQRTTTRYGQDNCLFAVAPDMPMDAYATLALSLPWLKAIRNLGVPAAFCAQDGSENGLIPWRDIDYLFLAGSTDWKLGPGARLAAAHSNERGIPVHMGRVNSFKRYRYAQQIGCHSADGTFLTFGPRINYPKLKSWDKELNDNPTLPWA